MREKKIKSLPTRKRFFTIRTAFCTCHLAFCGRVNCCNQRKQNRETLHLCLEISVLCSCRQGSCALIQKCWQRSRGNVSNGHIQKHTASGRMERMEMKSQCQKNKPLRSKITQGTSAGQAIDRTTLKQARKVSKPCLTVLNI